MIRERLQSSHGNGWAVGTANPSPAVNGDKRKGMDWESNSNTPTKSDNTGGEKSRLEKLGGYLGNLGSTLTQHQSQGQQKDAAEIMIGMFMHTPWPSSEIFRCLPSKLRRFGQLVHR